jgi:hypothetical protein
MRPVPFWERVPLAAQARVCPGSNLGLWFVADSRVLLRGMRFACFLFCARLVASTIDWTLLPRVMVFVCRKDKQQVDNDTGRELTEAFVIRTC